MAVFYRADGRKSSAMSRCTEENAGKRPQHAQDAAFRQFFGLGAQEFSLVPASTASRANVATVTFTTVERVRR